jgi:hypothetical protein
VEEIFPLMNFNLSISRQDQNVFNSHIFKGHIDVEISICTDW